MCGLFLRKFFAGFGKIYYPYSVKCGILDTEQNVAQRRDQKAMLVPILLFAVGLVCLIKGGDWFVDGSVGIARRFHIPELLIGATIVSIGTTLPEVMVSATSALSGHGEIAYGNAIGSVICNTALIAAITIAARPGPVDPKTLRLPVAFFFAAAAVYCVTAYAVGYFSRPVGVLLLALFAAYIIVSTLQMKKSICRRRRAGAVGGTPQLRERPAASGRGRGADCRRSAAAGG